MLRSATRQLRTGASLGLDLSSRGLAGTAEPVAASTVRRTPARGRPAAAAAAARHLAAAVLPSHRPTPPAAAALQETVKLLIDGQFLDSKTKEWVDVRNPATQEVVARLPLCTGEEFNAAVQSSKDAFPKWRTTPVPQRARVMLRLQVGGTACVWVRAGGGSAWRAGR